MRHPLIHLIERRISRDLIESSDKRGLPFTSVKPKRCMQRRKQGKALII